MHFEGHDTVLFTCKNGEHLTLTNTYFIPKLSANIISVGKLDDARFQVNVEGGVLRVHDEKHRLLARIHWSPSRLYVFNINIKRLMCLVTHV